MHNFGNCFLIQFILKICYYFAALYKKNYNENFLALPYLKNRFHTDIFSIISIIQSNKRDNISEQVLSHGESYYWIGLHDFKGEGRYQWLDETESVSAV